eukprot:CAMPEP_0174231676 /NCGR_PEP_ID=MMETSP0417-20130205/2152_1 /TAXON_ID=242541 /ORGANISM="Mayorella sp, Strain BSH-02190019" /LENGTH=1372 /DNA_ID=CAMNT_0015309601 /DNA_START=124 /DNA_END=4238 /DNA_ORIENTATION=-
MALPVSSGSGAPSPIASDSLADDLDQLSLGAKSATSTDEAPTGKVATIPVSGDCTSLNGRAPDSDNAHQRWIVDKFVSGASLSLNSQHEHSKAPSEEDEEDQQAPRTHTASTFSRSVPDSPAFALHSDEVHQSLDPDAESDVDPHADQTYSGLLSSIYGRLSATERRHLHASVHTPDTPQRIVSAAERVNLVVARDSSAPIPTANPEQPEQKKTTKRRQKDEKLVPSSPSVVDDERQPDGHAQNGDRAPQEQDNEDDAADASKHAQTSSSHRDRAPDNVSGSSPRSLSARGRSRTRSSEQAAPHSSSPSLYSSVAHYGGTENSATAADELSDSSGIVTSTGLSEDILADPYGSSLSDTALYTLANPEMDSYGYSSDLVSDSSEDHTLEPSATYGAEVYCYGEQDLYSPLAQADSAAAKKNKETESSQRAPEGIPTLLTEKELNENQWNRRLQELFENYYSQRGHIAQLVEEFAIVAEDIGRKIILELHLPASQRTIHPLRPGGGQLGIAGGQKYLQEGIFFKFATDLLGIYGNDEFSQKAAAHELRGLNWLFSAAARQSGGGPNLSFPIMTLIDFRGHRLVATSLLPIGRDTLVYGSDNAGVTVHKSNPKMTELIESLATTLNLKSHPVQPRCGRELVYLSMPIDLEGHVGRDNRYYVVDTHRVCPPEPPIRLIRGCHLVRLLRPELVEAYQHVSPLSPDAFSTFSASRAEDNREVIGAVKYLRDKVIPNFVRSVEVGGRYRSFEGSDWLAEGDVLATMHKRGINCRYLGRIYDLAKSDWFKQMVLCEILARTMKQLIRLHMREVRVARSSQYHKAALTPINLLYGTSDACKRFANEVLRKACLYRFTSLELAKIADFSEFLWKQPLLLREVFRATQLQAALIFTAGARKRLVEHIESVTEGKAAPRQRRLRKQQQLRKARFMQTGMRVQRSGNLLSRGSIHSRRQSSDQTSATAAEQEEASSSETADEDSMNPTVQSGDRDRVVFQAKDIESMYSRTKRFAIWLSPTRALDDEGKQEEGPRARDSLDELVIDSEKFVDRVVIMHGMTGVIFSARWLHENGASPRDFTNVAITLYHTHLLFLSFVDVAPMLIKHPHRNLVNVHGVAKFNNRWGAVTEYVRGSTLESTKLSRFLDVERGEHSRVVHIDWRSVLRLALDVIRGLYHLHSLSPPVMHRNVTAPNILFDETGQAKLNVVRLTNDTRVPSMGRGTVRMMSISSDAIPESGREYTEKSDVHAFGQLLRLLCRQLVHAIGMDASTMPTDCPPLFSDILQRCMARDPARRPTTAEIIKSLSMVTLNEASVDLHLDHTDLVARASSSTRPPRIWASLGFSHDEEDNSDHHEKHDHQNNQDDHDDDNNSEDDEDEDDEATHP